MGNHSIVVKLVTAASTGVVSQRSNCEAGFAPSIGHAQIRRFDREMKGRHRGNKYEKIPPRVQSTVFLVHNLCCGKCIELTYL